MDLRVNSCIPQNIAFKEVAPSAKRVIKHSVDEAIQKYALKHSEHATEKFALKATNRGNVALEKIKNFMKEVNYYIDLTSGEPTTSLFKFIYNDRQGYAKPIPSGDFMNRGNLEGLDAIEYFANNLSYGTKEKDKTNIFMRIWEFFMPKKPKLTPDIVHKRFLASMMETPIITDSRHFPDFATKEQALKVSEKFAQETNNMDYFMANKDKVGGQDEFFKRLFKKLYPGVKNI